MSIRHPIFVLVGSAALAIFAIGGVAFDHAAQTVDPAMANALGQDMALPVHPSRFSPPVDGLEAALSERKVDPGHVVTSHTIYRSDLAPTTVVKARVDLLVSYSTDADLHSLTGEMIYSNECTIVNGEISSRITVRNDPMSRDGGRAAGDLHLTEQSHAQCASLFEQGAFKVPEA